MVKQHDLRVAPALRVPPHQDVARVCITVDMAVVENHLGEDLDEEGGSPLRVPELFTQGVDVVDLDALHILHDDGSTAAQRHVVPRYVENALLALELLATALGIDDLGLEVKLLD